MNVSLTSRRLETISVSATDRGLISGPPIELQHSRRRDKPSAEQLKVLMPPKNCFGMAKY